MPPSDGLPHLIDIHLNFDAALRMLQWSRQIYIGGFSIYQWAWSWFVFSLSISIIRRLIVLSKRLAMADDGGEAVSLPDTDQEQSSGRFYRPE